MPKQVVVVQQITKPEAVKLTAAVDAKYKAMESGWWELGRLVRDCLHKRVPAALGMNAHEWMAERFGEATSRAWRALRSAKALQGIPEASVREMAEGNAYNLARLPEKERRSKEWIEKAVKEPVKDFKAEVEKHFEKRNGHKQVKFLPFHRMFPPDVHDLVLEAEAKIARVLKVDISESSQSKIAALITVWEGIASLINGTDAKRLKTEIEGDEDEDATRIQSGSNRNEGNARRRTIP